MSSPYLCVWWWSCNLLHGSRCWCRWVDRYIETKWGPLRDFIISYYVELWFYCNNFMDSFICNTYWYDLFYLCWRVGCSVL